MSNYLEFQFKIAPLQPGSEILIAQLGYAGFESFVETEEFIKAYIQKEEFTVGLLEDIQILSSDEFEISYTSEEIEQVNWNSEWEKNFNPIIVADKCSVRAPFHEKPDTEYDIVIEPKMSFGTGHHATTHMMLQHILRNEWNGKRVLDMGCGTGVLAILAEMKGATALDAIDIDNWCYLNTLENVERNNCTHINVYEGTAEMLKDQQYDVVIANINRNILLEDIPRYSKRLVSEGKMFLSGFYTEDVPAIEKVCKENGLIFEEKLVEDNWTAASFIKE